MHARMHSAGHAIGRQNRAQWQPSRQWFGHGNDVGLHTKMLVSKVFAGAPKAALDLIEKQQRAGLFGHLSRRLQKLAAERTNSALALNCLQANGANAAIELPLEIIDVIE